MISHQARKSGCSLLLPSVTAIPCSERYALCTSSTRHEAGTARSDACRATPPPRVRNLFGLPDFS
jgi:hypothetical protein